MMNRIESLTRTMAAADTTTVFIGAGISTESGITDFRSEGGIWEQYDPDQFHVQRFKRDPGSFWEDWIGMFDEVFTEDVEPNAGHEVITDLVSADQVDTVITQNSDGLYQTAGVSDDAVIELHGTTEEVVCPRCRRRFLAEPVRNRVRDDEIPPICSDCGDALKPGGVLFGEQLPERALLSAHACAKKSDCFLVVGSSLTIEPAASLPETAVDRSATLAIANPDPTLLSERAAFTFHEEAGTVLPALRDAVLKRSPFG